MKKYCLDIDPDRYLLGELLGFLGGAAVEQPPVDPGQPYEPAHVGLFPKTLAVDGVQRRILTYIPPHFPTSGAGLFVFLDDGFTDPKVPVWASKLILQPEELEEI